MCLNIVEKNVEFEKRLNNSKRKEVVCWKVYIKKCASLESPFFTNCVEKSGVVYSSRKEKELGFVEENGEMVGAGIHVFTSREEVREYNDDVEYAVIPVTCRLNDLVATGTFFSGRTCKDYGSAVFMKVRIRSRDWNKIFKKI